MADYPRSLREFQRRFPDDAACGEHLARTRWPEGFACPRCGGREAWRLPSRTPLTFGCKGCGKETSVTAGTIMHRTHLPLSVWFWAAYLVATHSNGMSAKQLQSELAIASYETAWLLSMKLRAAMIAPERTPLSGFVEADETTIPFRTRDDPPAGGQGRSHDGKLLLIAAVEVVNGKNNKLTLGRMRLAPIADFARNSLHAFIGANTAPGTIVKTDGLAAYLGAPNVTHEPHVVGTMAAHVRSARHPSRLLQPQDMGARRLSWPAAQTLEGLPR